MDPKQSDELGLLRCIRLKGLADVPLIASVTGLAEPQVSQDCAALAERGLLVATARGLQLTTDGRGLLTELIGIERTTINDDDLQAAYVAFCGVNDQLKAVVSAWQMRQKAAGNATQEASPQERAIIERLVGVDAATVPVFTTLTALVPRLARYRIRLDQALDRIVAGDFSFIARPIIDSYHTVWFELHEDLLGLTGRTRAEEAAAGRAG